ncbi:MAG TPA: CBS domain-containing protein [Pyrinomonadaceae bacterium]|nr:CBS domain-containing protein [Pyrinomonadaceae bacterium]
MKVKDVMTRDAKTCGPQASLAAAAALMWENDCGTLPVVEDGGRVVGMITDRDICIGAATKNRAPSEIAVGEVITGEVYACAPDDDMREALETMRRERVHRLPVVGADGELRGVVSMNDVVLRAELKADGEAPELTYADVVQTYKAICAHPRRELELSQRQQAATA